ncbi:MAG: hypothetical protein V4609_17785 [Pseudomonadota bacterium]
MRGAHSRAQEKGRQEAPATGSRLRERGCAVGSAPPEGTPLQQLRRAALEGINDPQERAFIEMQLQLAAPPDGRIAQLQAAVTELAASPRADELVVRHLGEGLRNHLREAKTPPPDWTSVQGLSPERRAWLAEGADAAFVARQTATLASGPAAARSVQATGRTRLAQAVSQGWVLKSELATLDATDAGGKSGSKRVRTALGTFQLKSPVSWFTRAKKRKTAGSHTDNFAEVIGSRLARALASQGRDKLIAQVSLVYDDQHRQLQAASKYLAEPDACWDLDKYHQRSGGGKDAKTHHVRIDLRPTQDVPDKNVLRLTDAQQVGDLCENIALSAWVDDADVNPGNMMVVGVDGHDRLGRIDFGHAFADLVFAPERFGGGRDPKVNPILDFFNREKVGGGKLGGSPNTVWRNYIGVVPSQAMATALKGLSERASGARLEAALAQARAPFDELVQALSRDGSRAAAILRDEARESLAAIGHRLGLPARADTLPAMVDEVFGHLGQVMARRAEQMAQVAALGQLQVDIDLYIDASRQDDKGGVPDLPEAIERDYDRLRAGAAAIDWMKCSREEPAFRGDLRAYIAWRSRQAF